MKRVAIIGTGISGMGAAYTLKDAYDITMYESEDYVGGHTHTLTVDENGVPVPIDSAFMVYNEVTYPLLTRLFQELDVKTQPTDMSFSFQHLATGLEYCGTGLNGLFAQRKNLWNFRFWGMLLDIDRFRRESPEVLKDARFADYSVVRYIQERRYGQEFLYKFLVPMSSAVWSSPATQMEDFPIVTLVRFFTNHCFLGLQGHLKWRTCVGGSWQYRDKLLSRVKARCLTKTPVAALTAQGKGVLVSLADGRQERYDHAIVCCHGDTALRLLIQPSDLQRDLLGTVHYHHNRITLHTDERMMPKTRQAWSSWNYRVAPNGQTSTLYWMNNLQHLLAVKNYFVSVDDPGLVDPATILFKTMYSHPVYDVALQKAQPSFPQLNVGGPMYFAGAYFRYGFHEDGLMAGVNAANALAGEKRWG